MIALTDQPLPRQHARHAPFPGNIPAPERKAGLRREMKQRLRMVSPAAWQSAGARIARALFSLAAWREAQKIAVYLNTADEVPTAPVIEECRKRRIEMYLPVYDSSRQLYAPAAWHENDSMRPGAYGISEPVSPRWSPSILLDLIIVPGRAFTRLGTRLGRGGGHYDRFLSGPWAANAVTVGLALERQVVETLVREPHDAAVALLATEEGIYTGSNTTPTASRPAGHTTKTCDNGAAQTASRGGN